MTSTKTFGEAAYEAYCRSRGFEVAWAALAQHVRAAWEDAAAAARVDTTNTRAAPQAGGTVNGIAPAVIGGFTLP